MILQEQTSRTIGEVKYKAWSINIPQKVIIQVGWKKGEELNLKVIDGKIILEKANGI